MSCDKYVYHNIHKGKHKNKLNVVRINITYYEPKSTNSILFFLF